MTTALTVNPTAQEQAAMHRTELLLARCRHCPPYAPMANLQAHWHEQQQAHYLAWLDAGGFAQCHPERAEHAQRDPAPATELHPEHDTATLRPIENSGIAPLFSVP